MGGWLSGRALPSHGRGHRFEPCSAQRFCRRSSVGRAADS